MATPKEIPGVHAVDPLSLVCNISGHARPIRMLDPTRAGVDRQHIST